MLGDWPTTRRAGRRLLEMDRRSGVTGVEMLGYALGMVARGIEESRPEAAAVLHGAARRLAQPPAADAARFLELFYEECDRPDAVLAEALGRTRLGELCAQGEAMDRDETCAYARRELDAYLSTLDGAQP